MSAVTPASRSDVRWKESKLGQQGQIVLSTIWMVTKTVDAQNLWLTEVHTKTKSKRHHVYIYQCVWVKNRTWPPIRLQHQIKESDCKHKKCCWVTLSHTSLQVCFCPALWGVSDWFATWVWWGRKQDGVSIDGRCGNDLSNSPRQEG